MFELSLCWTAKRFRQTLAHDHGHKLRKRLRRWRVPGWPITLRGQREPIEAVRRQGQEISEFSDGRKWRPSIQLHRHAASELREVELHCLRTMREVGDTQQHVALILTEISKDFPILGRKQSHRAAAEGRLSSAHGEHETHPV